MGLSLLHQTVNPVGASFTPNLLLYGWFTLHWACANADFVINTPNNGTNGQEFIVDVLRVGNHADPQHFIGWVGEDPYWSGIVADQNPDAQFGMWTGENGSFVRGVRHRFRILNGACCLEAYNAIVPY